MKIITVLTLGIILNGTIYAKNNDSVIYQVVAMKFDAVSAWTPGETRLFENADITISKDKIKIEKIECEMTLTKVSSKSTKTFKCFKNAEVEEIYSLITKCKNTVPGNYAILKDKNAILYGDGVELCLSKK